MRYISSILLIGFVALTFYWSKSEATIGVRVHNDIQMDLAKIIQAAVKAKLPDVSDIQFTKLVSKTIDTNHVRVSFTYNFQNKSTEDNYDTAISGHSLVTRSQQDANLWTLESMNIDGSAVEFQNGMTVTRETSE